jgi:S1-C subfamily serine protease
MGEVWYSPEVNPADSNAGSPADFEPAAPRRRRRRAWLAVLVAGGVAVGAALATLGSGAVVEPSARSTANAGPATSNAGSSPSGSAQPGLGAAPAVPAVPGGDDDSLSGADPGQQYQQQFQNVASTLTYATTAQQVGVVDINTVLGFQGARAAGTGMILSSNGEILTNNHVIAGATSINVMVVSSGRTYLAKVVGYDATEDIAVLQLVGASGLQPVTTDSSAPALGSPVVGVGNAGGAGGTPTAAAGTVVAIGQNIPVNADNGTIENLVGMIESNAGIQAGDSGGPMFNSSNKVIGMDAAASVGGATQGFAMPISRVLAVAATIESGQASSTIHLGTSAFLGIDVAGSGLAQVAGVIAGTPAAAIGLAPGDVITSVSGHLITTAQSLTTAMQSQAAGSTVSIAWTDVNGTAHRASVTLTSGPAV